MKNKKILLGLSAALVLAFLLVAPSYVSAKDINQVFSFTYSLTEGGVDRIEFDKNYPYEYKGIKIQVTKTDSNTSQQYEIYQDVVGRFENRNNPSQAIKDNDFVFHRISDGTPAGNFKVQTNDVPVRTVRYLYTSDAAGSSANFTLLYGIKGIDELEPGEYHIEVDFILRPVGQGNVTGQITKYLFIIVRVPQEGLGKPNIEISTVSGSRTIVLNSARENQRAADVVVKINKKYREFFDIAQMLTRLFESNEGNRLDPAAVNVETQNVRTGTGIPRQSLSEQPKIIYTSKQNGDSDDAFVITYSLGDLSKQKAGRYRTNIQYILEKMGKQTRLDALELEVENERVFDIIIKPQDQKSMIEFPNLKPKDEPKKSEVVIEIKTNTGKQYQVTQSVSSALTDKEGNKIPPENFTLHTENIESKGALKIPQKSPVKTGDTLLFVSDPQGSAGKFKVVYELKIPEIIKGGDYSSKIVYSLSEI